MAKTFTTFKILIGSALACLFVISIPRNNIGAQYQLRHIFSLVTSIDFFFLFS